MAISRDMWMSALKEAAAAEVEDDPDVMTLAEISEMWNCTLATARRRCVRLVNQRLAVRKTVKRMCTDGKARPHTGFKLDLPKKKKR